MFEEEGSIEFVVKLTLEDTLEENRGRKLNEVTRLRQWVGDGILMRGTEDTPLTDDVIRRLAGLPHGATLGQQSLAA